MSARMDPDKFLRESLCVIMSGFIRTERGRTQRHTVQDSGEDATTPLPGSKAAAAHATVFVSFTASSRTRCACTMAVAP